MENLKLIQQCLDYVEENLTTDITIEELSAKVGFSVFHFCHIFKFATGMGVMEYITKRRILWAVYEITGGMKISDAALKYGFNTSAGFYKAFRKNFNCSPSFYAKRYKKHKPYRIDLYKEEHIMLTEKNLRNILKVWNIKNCEIKNIIYESTGEINDHSFLVDNRYYLKVFTNLGTVKRNIDIQLALLNKELPAVLPILTKDNEEYFTDGELYFILTEKVKGKPLLGTEVFADNYEKKAYYLGEIVGKLHTALKNQNDITISTKDIFKEVTDEWLQKAERVMNIPCDITEAYLSYTEKYKDKLPIEVIHRDLNPSNMLMDNFNLTGFIDFDLSQKSIRIFDPCYLATGILCDSISQLSEAELDKWPTIFKNIIKGYDSVAHLTDEEKLMTPFVLLNIELICVGFFSTQEKFTSALDTNVKMTEFILKKWNEIL